MMTKPSLDEYAQFLRQLNHLEQQVAVGSRDLRLVRESIQRLIEGDFEGAYIRGMFVSPEMQVENVRRWNEKYNWGFTEEQFFLAEADMTVLRWPLPALTALVLVPFRTTLEDTFWSLWNVILDEHDSLSPRRSCGYDQLELLEVCKEFEPDTLGWFEVELDAFWSPRMGGSSPILVRNSDSAHVHLLAAAAHFPKWLEAMDGKSVPDVVLSGMVSGRSDWTKLTHPTMCNARGIVFLGETKDTYVGFAVPVAHKAT